MPIQPELLARYRGKYRPETTLVWIRLERVAPGWWATLDELAQEIGVHRSALVRALSDLDLAGLIARDGRPHLGNWVWWVKRSIKDKPRPSDAPVWEIRDLSSGNRNLIRVPVGTLAEWGHRRGVPRKTLNSWMAGRQRVLRGRYEIVAAPCTGVVDCDNAD